MTLIKNKKLKDTIHNKVDVSNDNIANTNIKTNIIHNVNDNQYQQLWGGHYTGKIDKLCSDALSTIKFDWRFYNNSIKAYKAHIRMCVKRDVLNSKNGQALQDALDKIKKEINTGKIQINPQHCKNIHSFIKNLVIENVGATIGELLNIGYSEEEHDLTVLKLWMRDALDSTDLAIQNLQASCIDKAEANVKIVIPTYVHNQAGQAVSLAHYLMSYGEMLQRDRERIASTRMRLNTSPLGVHMGAGSSFDISRKMTSRALGFDKIAGNAMDVICDRDFAIEFMSTISICSTHLSKISQDLLNWNSPNTKFITFSTDFMSIDPFTQKARYAEVVEYIRSKSGTISGNLMNILMTLKGLDSSLSRDSNEIAEPIFNSHITLLNCLNIIAALVVDFKVNRKRTKERSQVPHSFGADILHWLLQNTSVDYTKALNITQKIITKAIEDGTKLSLLELNDLQKIEPQINDKIYSILIPLRAIIQKRTEGGTNHVNLRKSARVLRRKLTV